MNAAITGEISTRLLYVTYNVPPINHWRQLLSSFIGDLVVSGLYNKAAEIWIFSKEPFLVTQAFSNLSKMERVKIFIPDKGSNIAMAQLREISKHSRAAVTTNAYLYASARGISYSLYTDARRFLSVQAWAKMLNYFSIHQFEDAIARLGDFDAVGTNWIPPNNAHGVPPHFQGLGWWAAGEYLRSLPSVPEDSRLIELLKDSPTYIQRAGKNPSWALWGEFWIGFNNPRIFEQFSAYPKNSPPNWHYHNIISEVEYDKDYFS